MSPRVRRALHEALDHILDAVAADEAAQAAESIPRPKRVRAPKERKMPEGVDEFTKRRAADMAKRMNASA